MAWFIGVDVGGTFTDFFAFDGEGRVALHKVASTPDDPGRAIVEGLKALVAEEGVPLAAIARLEHGTTVATNALIQRKGARVALITTSGFRDLLDIGRQIRPHMFDMQKDHPPPLVARERIVEVAERAMADGSVRRPLTEQAIEGAVAAVAAGEVEAVAVCLLFSFLAPDHERRLGMALAKALPDLAVSLSCEVQPEFREYERCSTTLLNAYLQPVVARYLGRLGERLRREIPKAHVGISRSAGGLMSIDRALRFPIRTALSGPAAGVLGAIHIGRLAARPDLVTLDMGGTSADVCLIRNHQAGTAFNRQVAGFPVRLPMIDIETVGAGGGSIAWFDRDGLLKVGPVSAGAVPGPACYGQGGTLPAVTDANLLLGRLSAEGLIGGRMPLDPGASRAALAPVAERLGMSVERTAHGVLAIVVSNMVRAIRAVSVERGHDPRGFSLCAFGGAGPLHAIDVARALGMREVLVPPAPGILCAQGLCVSDLREDFVRSARLPVVDDSREVIEGHLAALVEDAALWLRHEELSLADGEIQPVLDMRYVGQNFELLVPLAPGRLEDGVTLPPTAELKELFFRAHEQSYGYFNPDDPVEIVNFRLSAFGRLQRPQERAVPPAAEGPPVPIGERPVWFEALRAATTPVFHRDHLRPGHVIAGPAVIEQLDATSLVYPGDRARVDAALNLLIEVTP
jgi:N-methylhydantoinase A